MAVNPSYASNFSIVDRSGEISGFTVNLAAPFDAVTPGTPHTDFVAAVAGVTDGVLLRVNGLASLKVSNVATAPAGQREDKWLCTYQDNVTLALYALELPCRKSALTTVAGTDTVDLGVAPWIAFKTAFETYVKSPDQNATTLLEVRLVGRNS